MSDDITSQSTTSVAAPTCTVISSIVPATSSDLSLTLFNPPGPLSVVESLPPQPPQPSSPESASSSSSSSRTEHKLKDSSQDIISRPTQDILVISHDSDLSIAVPSSSSSTAPTPKPDPKPRATFSENHRKGKGRETVEDVLYDLSLQLTSSVSSISQALDMDFIRALAHSFNREVSEILALLDQFVQEIKSHGVHFLEDPKITYITPRPRDLKERKSHSQLHFYPYSIPHLAFSTTHPLPVRSQLFRALNWLSVAPERIPKFTNARIRTFHLLVPTKPQTPVMPRHIHSISVQHLSYATIPSVVVLRQDQLICTISRSNSLPLDKDHSVGIRGGKLRLTG